MPVVAVVNRKGGSGKSTLATHLAAHLAHAGVPVMLGDVDKQQSTQAWLRLRSKQPVTNKVPIVGWTVDARSVLRSPPGVTHVILDTPGGLRGFDLARVVMFADAIVMPVCNSVFDRESAADCFAELMTLPRVATGKCKVAAVGMRLDARTKADETLREWAGKHEIPFIGVLRETQGYVRCVEQGLTLFDLPPSKVESDLAQWQPILQWLHPVLHPKPVPAPVSRPIDVAAASSTSTNANASARADSLRPAQSTLPAAQQAVAPRPPAPRLQPAKPALPQPPAAEAAPARTGMADRVGNWLGSWGVSRLLQR
ncbi:ParA family protein [Piscinibacter sp. HJYY11]|uniref:ParA family protein n=1 Tax=Piscinibacter sp. HJYY11 TaxID=2801333 RepID=UPI00191E64ED|nr:ParA family protein [Piscinibacter sp. HJYY11]MBL0727153.1 AAA family ATPase [Piscinibacter sp. HJYY11]